MRCWVARLDVRHRDHHPITSTTYAYGTDRDQVADQVEQWTKPGVTTWLYAHNLSFDASVTDLPMELIRRGWEMTSANIVDSPTWFRFRRGRSRLVLADSWGIWPCSLAALARDMGMAKTELPHNDDDDMSGWWQRCEQDVTILATALLTSLRYWDDNRLGRWSVTGSGTGWSAFKTNFVTDKILIDIDDKSMTFEQRCTYGGRREAFRLGEWKSGQFVDLDFQAAYPSIVASHTIPVRRRGHFDTMDSDTHRHRSPTRGIIAECEVSTTEPVVPVRYGESIFYPVGQFRTVLASPEIDLVEQTGGYVHIGQGYSYDLAPAMHHWGRWVIGMMHGRVDQVPAVVRRQAKHWSRAVIGRWTMRLSREEDLPGYPTNGQLVTRAEWLDYDERDIAVVDGLRRTLPGAVPTSRVKGYQVLFGDRYYALRQDVWPENGFPAVWCWVESWCRVHLWQAMAAMPPGDVWQCDTDGFLLGRTARSASRRRAGAAGGDDWPPGLASTQTGNESSTHDTPLLLVEKGRYTSARILGPQHTVLGGQRRFPGIPRDAVEVTPGTFQAQTWPGFLTQLEAATPGTFQQRHVRMKIGAGLNPRWSLASGRTLPVTMSVRDGRNAIEPPPQWTSSGNAVCLADDQHSVLSRIRRDSTSR
jgi:hypothetical protein